MSRTPTARRRLTIKILAVTATASAALLGGVSASSASTVHHSQPPVTAGAHYLALGDSVAFGYREATNPPNPNYHHAKSFVGYPEDVAASLGLTVANSSCPGETSSSFLTTHVTSNGCENSVGSTIGYRDRYPLHVKYAGTQMSYAIHYLKTHSHTRLVSLMIGANDGFVCQGTTSDSCASEFPAVLKQIKANVKTILTNIRSQAHYSGQIVIVNYYSLDYTSAVQTGMSKALNQAMDSAAKNYHVHIADGYGTFKKAATQAGGDTCKAGLITTLSGGGCGIHPSVSGQALLAQAVERAIKH